jgi:signal transduction histidine kinase
MSKILESVSAIGLSPRDREDTILQKRFLVYQAVLMSLGGIIWGMLAIAFDRTWQSSVPFGYVLLTMTNLTFFHVTRNFGAAKTIQTSISLLLPFLFQWSLGGFVASGAVMLWAMLSLAASVTYQSNRTVMLWLVLYVLLTILSGVFDKTFVDWIQPDDAAPYSVLFMVLNVVVISAIVLWLVNFMVRGKHDALQKLQQAQSQLVQSEKMATLGTLAAGVAHELNNPAAATQRASQQLLEVLPRVETARETLLSVNLTRDERQVMMTLAERARDISINGGNNDSLVRSDLEEEVEVWLEEEAIDDAWELAPALVAIGLTKDRLHELSSKVNMASLKAIVIWVAHVRSFYSLIHEISEGSGRLSEIVMALKSYSFLGQAPLQQISIHQGLDNTLVILRTKLRGGITVHRHYGTGVPEITAYGSELNQVWTNILDNAIDAMEGKGEITISTRTDNGGVAVEIEDTGRGIPESIQSRIFDPFFTTKEPGRGTGLGLSTTYGIITEKHKGTIRVQSRPGSTKFIVRLPIQIPQQNGPTQH